MKIFIPITAILMFVIGNMYIQARHEEQQNKNIVYVQQICDEAHHEINGASEEACGKAQDETNTEYLCTTRTNDGFCWVESK